MAATVHVVGKPAHDAERQALAYLAAGLPASFQLYANSWLAQRDGAVYELDAVVLAPHAAFIVEIKSYRGRIEGTDHDWLLPAPRPSPLRLNRLTAQVLKGEVKRRSAAAGRCWVEGLVFLSHTTDLAIEGPASRARVHSRATILDALRRPEFLRDELMGGRLPEPLDDHARQVFHAVLTGADQAHQPSRRVREWQLRSVLDRGEDYTEYLAENEMSQKRRLLRVYSLPWSAGDEERQRVVQRCSWEAQVLVSVGQHPNILDAESPFQDEIGICQPLEHFPGLSLASWLERYPPEGPQWPPLAERLRLWRQVAEALHFAHRRGVVHRLLRPEVILLEDKAQRPQLRLAGFELAKQLSRQATIVSSLESEERLTWAAPEILRDFHEAAPTSDQFSLGMLLALLALGRPLAESSAAFLRRGAVAPSLSDLDARLPKALDLPFLRLLALRPADRFATVLEAMRAVDAALRPERTAPAPEPRLDPEHLPAGHRLGVDYEVRERLGEGGLSTVYLALHLMSGEQRALKVAHPDPTAEDALRAEYAVLSRLDHPAIVRAIDLTAVVPERITLIMERADGEPLPRWLDGQPDPDPTLLRGYAEDLLDALAYLEQQGLTHKDIKPDNLMLGRQALRLIDFSLASEPVERLAIGTPLYRDPAMTAWDAAADRYAAALCLFELFVGAHAFGGKAPQPDEAVALDEDEVNPPAMADFLRRALAPAREARYESLDAMRQALRRATGQAPTEAPVPAAWDLSPDPAAPLPEALLTRGAYNALRRNGLSSQADLVAMDEDTLARLRGVGRRRWQEICALRAALLQRGMVPAAAAPAAEPPFFEPLVGDERPVDRLGLSEGLTATLKRAHLNTVGALAQASRTKLLAVPWLGDLRLLRLEQVLRRLSDPPTGSPEDPETASLEAAWEAALAELSPRQQEVAMALAAPADVRPASQTALAERLAVSRQAVSQAVVEARGRLRAGPLGAVLEGLAAAMAAAGGLLPQEDALEAVVTALPTEDEGLAKQVLRLAAFGLDWSWAEAGPGPRDLREPVLALTAELARGAAELPRRAAALAEWPPMPAVAISRSLAAGLPGYGGDAAALVTGVAEGFWCAPSGELIAGRVTLAQALAWLLPRSRLPLTLAELTAQARAALGLTVDWPEDEAALAAALAALDLNALGLGPLRLEEGRLLEAGVDAPPPAPLEDALPPAWLRGQASPGEAAAEQLRLAAGHGHWRLVVTPPERHRLLGRGVAAALGPEARFISLEDRLLARMEPRFAEFERAELYKAQKWKLRQEAEGLLREILEQEGAPGRRRVLGDTGLLQLCEATDLLNWFYNQTLSGAYGFWALVIPGVIYGHTPLFNEKERLPLLGEPLPLRELATA